MSRRKNPDASRIRHTATAAVVSATIAVGAAAPAHAADALLPGASDATVIYVPPTAPHPWSAGTVNLAGLGAEITSLLGTATQAFQIGYAASLAPFTGPGNTMALNPSVAQGTSALNTEITSAPAGTKFIIFGMSQGGIVETSEMLALMKAGSTADITWVRIADESTPYGLMGRNVGLLLPGASCILMPQNSHWNQDIVMRQYDGFADFPRNEWDILADLNAFAGILEYHNNVSYSVDLSLLPASDVTTSVNQYGATITTYVIPSPGLIPLLWVLKNAGVNDKIVNALQPILKPIVDLGYQPITLPVLGALGQKTFVAVVNAAAAAGVWTVNSARSTQATMTAAAKSLSAMARNAAVAAALAAAQHRPATSVTASPAAATSKPTVSVAAEPSAAASAVVTPTRTVKAHPHPQPRAARSSTPAAHHHRAPIAPDTKATPSRPATAAAARHHPASHKGH